MLNGIADQIGEKLSKPSLIPFAPQVSLYFDLP
jgi:hypothetical protein